MKFLSTVALTLASLASSALALPLTSSSDSASPSYWVRSILEKRQINPVVGLTDGISGGFRPYRKNLNVFVQNADQTNLYIQGLLLMQNTAYSDQKSYYAISGIHGRPYHGWNGEAGTGNTNTGYCTHASILFPTWHRPYLALYEQSLHLHMQNIVNKFPAAERPRWQSALFGFRIPFWDWATNNAQMPSILTQQYVTVTKPTGQASILNPLYSFKFPSLSSNDFPSYPFYQWHQTVRYPTNTQPHANSQDGLVNQQLAANAASLRQRVFTLLTSSQYFTYAAISNKAANVGAPDSLEGVHDVIHGLTGNGGHMSYIDYSAFDPIFYLHHANIDRLFAIWQALNPNAWIGNQVNPFGTYGIPPGTNEDQFTPLTPFRNAQGFLYDSQSVRQISYFGYSYPELNDWRYHNNPSGYRSHIIQQVNSLYGSTSQQLAAALNKRDDGLASESAQGNATATAVDNSVQNSMYYDWKVDIHTNKLACGGSYFVHIFLGIPSDDPKQWSFQKELAGDFVVFVNKMEDAPCLRNEDCPRENNLVSGVVPITQALLDRIVDVGSLNPSDVVPYLKKTITWKVSLMNDTSIAVEHVADLKISVSAAVVTLPPKDKVDTEFPTYGPYKFYEEVTTGRAGGGLPTDSPA